MPEPRGHVNDLASLTIRQVADYLQVAERTVYKLAWAGELPGFKVGNTWRFKKEDIDRWIETKKRRARSSSRR
jgi:excisionase family DNA binding protein